MNISPSNIRYANSLPTCVAVYLADEKRNILIFKSIFICVKYLFSHRVKKKNDIGALYYLIQTKCCQQKQREDQNKFALYFTYRLANDEQKAKLGQDDFIILDERFENKEYTSIQTLRGIGFEGLFKQDDAVEILDGSYKGRIGIISEIKSCNYRRRGNFGTGATPNFEYIVIVDKKPLLYKAYNLQPA